MVGPQNLSQLADALFPGPCPPEGCPPPTEVDCIEVSKVYDYCFQQDLLENVCATISVECPAVSASCVVSATCIVGATTPGSTTGFINASFGIVVSVTFTLFQSSGEIACTGVTTASLVKIVTLCGPPGTFQDCRVESVSCGPSVLFLGSVCTSVVLCLTFQSLAIVKILVPTYGFCVPAPCTTGGLPPCPPGTLFPPQCT